MGFATYIARRQLAPGHVVGVSYTLPLILTVADRPSTLLTRQPESLSGNVETLYFGEVTNWEFAVAAEPGRRQLVLREFLASIGDGQVFTLDPYGTPEVSSSELMNCVRTDRGTSAERVLSSHRDGENDYFAYRFSVRKV